MLRIEIDGKEVSVKEGSNVIEAANLIGTYIPHFCYHKKLSVVANCRMCLVEVANSRKPLPACATIVSDGMKVFTNSQLAKNAREAVMEFLLINHPLDCPICDQGGECQLQDLSVGYGKGYSRYKEPKRIVSSKNMGALVAADEMTRCIHCTRCIRFTEEIAGYQEIGMINRGEHSEIVPFVEKVIESEISGNVIDLCPVGALTSKPFRYKARGWELSRRKSISAHDSLGSNLIVQVQDRLVKRVLPFENESINESWLSDKDRFAYEGLNHEKRLKKPMIKQNNNWHEVEWDIAFDYVVKSLNKIATNFSKDSIGVLASPASTLEELYLIKEFCNKFGINSFDSRLKSLDYRLYNMKNGVLWLGQEILDFLKSESVLIIGCDLRKEQPLLTSRIRRMANQQTKVSIINFSKEELHLPLLSQLVVNPKNIYDVLLDLNNLIDKNDKESHNSNDKELLKIFNSLNNKKRTTIILGSEAINHPDFTNIYLLSYKLSQKTNSIMGIFPQYCNSVGADLLSFMPKYEKYSLKDMLSNPRKAVFTINIEPDIDLFNNYLFLQSLKKAQTVIACTSYISDTFKEYADVLLPISPFTETSGSFINMEGNLQSFNAVVQPLGDTKPLWKIIRVLGNLFNLEGFDYVSSQEVLDKIKLNYNLKNALNNSIEDKLIKRILLKGNLIRIGGVGLYFTDSIVRRAKSLQLTPQSQEPLALVNGQTLKKLSIKDGDKIKIRQDDNIIEANVKKDDKISCDCVYLPFHETNKLLGSMFHNIELIRG